MAFPDQVSKHRRDCYTSSNFSNLMFTRANVLPVGVSPDLQYLCLDEQFVVGPVCLILPRGWDVNLMHHGFVPKPKELGVPANIHTSLWVVACDPSPVQQQAEGMKPQHRRICIANFVSSPPVVIEVHLESSKSYTSSLKTTLTTEHMLAGLLCKLVAAPRLCTHAARPASILFSLSS
eukprot:361151-Chlamydomonas_euryale.AAC.2